MEKFLLALKEFSNKYLVYFDGGLINNHQSELLNDVSQICEMLDSNTLSPIETLKEVMEKFGYKDSFYNHIFDIKDHFSSLSIYELFIILYFCTCRNPLTFDNNFYITALDNGCIVSLLREINKKLPK